MPKIKLSKAIQNMCMEFAEECVDTNVSAYKRRGQSDRAKIVEQIYTGKMGEMAVHKLLGCDKPDFKIYKAKEKSFSADLMLGEFEIHVKSQSRESSNKYGTSWMFTVGDKLIEKPQTSDLAALCVQDGAEVELYTVLPLIVAVPLLRFPVVHQLRHSKRVLYWDDLKFSENSPTSKVEGEKK